MTWTPFERQSVAAIALLGAVFVASMTMALGRPKPAGDPNPAARIDPKPPGSLRGRILRSDGRPFPGAFVEAHYNKEGDRIEGEAQTGRDGGFLLESLASDRVYDVVVTAPDCSPSMMRRVRVPPAETVTLGSLKLGASPEDAVVFDVIEASGSAWKPVDKARVRLLMGTADAASAAPRLYFVTVADVVTGADGRASFFVHKADDKRRPLPYKVCVSKDGFDPQEREFNPVEAQGSILLTRRSP